MNHDDPIVRSRRTETISPFIDIIAREVVFAPDAVPEIYHAVGQADYVSVVALTADGLLPLVRQYRPAVEGFTWELPAGTVDAGEDPAHSACRELLEETGYPALACHPLGRTSPCTGRMSNFLHSYFVTAGPRRAGFAGEPGLSVQLVSLPDLLRMIRSGEFISQLHIGAILQAALAGHLDLTAACQENAR